MRFDSEPLHEPVRLPAWALLALCSGVLWGMVIWTAFISLRGDVPNQLFAGTLAAAGVATMTTVMVAKADGRRTADAHAHAAVLAQLGENATQIEHLVDTMTLMVGAQKRMATALGEQAAKLEQISARIDDANNPERVEWQSYAQACSDLLGIGGKVVPLDPRRRGTRS